MKILVTNDDGIRSPGLWAAVQAVQHAGEVFVVAPDREQSGVSSSLSLHAPVRAYEVPSRLPDGVDSVKSYAVEGTPGDSCVLALEKLVGPVDLLVSGINNGSNLGEDVLISGTVGAAFQGYVRGYPSIAISVGAVKDTRYDMAMAFLRLVADRLAEGHPLPGSLMNVNIPNQPADRIEGVKVTRLGRRSYGESVTERNDGRHITYMLSRDKPVFQGQDQDEDTDTWALKHNRISITPIGTALTDVQRIPELENLFQGYSSRLLGRETSRDQ